MPPPYLFEAPVVIGIAQADLATLGGLPQSLWPARLSPLGDREALIARLM